MISVVIMAHPKRERWATALSRELDAPIVWDASNNVWDTGRRALLAFDPKATHHLVVQDDSLPASDLVHKATNAARYDAPIAFYMGARREGWVAKGIETVGTGLLSHAGPIWGPAILNPTERIPALVEFCDRLNVRQYDRRQMDYWRSVGIECLYSVPSLVDHRPVAENPSLADAKRTGNRHAEWFHPTIEPDWAKVQHTDTESLWPSVILLHPDGRRRKRMRVGAGRWERYLSQGWKIEQAPR